MKQILRLIQGSPEWKAHRTTPGMINGSEIAAIMGLDPKTSRGEMLRMKALGGEKEFSDYVQTKVLDKGHENEALARPIAEEIIGDDLSPLVITDTIDGLLFSVSLDGITQGHDTTHEHKSLNQMLAEALDAGTLPEQYGPQCEAGLMVSGATRCLFMASKDGDRATARHYWYESSPELRQRMIAACKQFEEDRKNYVHVEVAERPKAEISIELPALFIQAKGQITDSNMVAYGEALKAKLAEVRAIVLATDQDFSNAKAAAAMFREQCKKLKLAKEQMLEQTVSIGEAARMMDAWAEDLRLTALQLEGDVEREDAAKKAAIIAGAKTKHAEHINALNTRIGGKWMPSTVPDFASAIKGKRNYRSMHDAVDAMLASAKLDADQIAGTIEDNRKVLQAGNGAGTDYSFLVPDFASVCTKARDDFDALVTSRLAAHREREEAERERIRQEEAARIAKEAENTANMQAAVNAETGPAPTSANDQRGKTVAGGGELQPQELRQPSATTSAQPIQQSVRAIEPEVAMITEFLALQSCSPADKKTMRAAIERWETYRIKMTMAREMAAAA